MTFQELRKKLVAGLWRYLDRPVILANQVQPEPDYPFGIYTVTAPYIPDNTMGDYTTRNVGDELAIDRRVMPTATFSFTFCSANREAEDGTTISGADEAEELADKAAGYFLHVGYDDFLKLGIAIVDVGQVGDRTMLIIDEADRRYGFDVIVRYTRIDTRMVETIKDYNIKQEESEMNG